MKDGGKGRLPDDGEAVVIDGSTWKGKKPKLGPFGPTVLFREENNINARGVIPRAREANRTPIGDTPAVQGARRNSGDE